MAFSLVTSGKNASGGSASDRTVTIGGGTSGSDLFVAHVGYFQGSGTAPTLADSQSNTWLPSGGYLEDGVFGNRHSRLWYCIAPTTTGGSHTFTFTENGSSKFMSAVVLCYGAGGAPTYDNHGVSNTIVNNVLTMTLTPVANDCLIVGSYCTDGDLTTLLTSVLDNSGGSTFDNTTTNLPTQYFNNDVGSGFVGSGMSHRFLSGGAGAATGVKWTWNVAGSWPGDVPAQLITFAPPASGGGTFGPIIDGGSLRHSGLTNGGRLIA